MAASSSLLKGCLFRSIRARSYHHFSLLVRSNSPTIESAASRHRHLSYSSLSAPTTPTYFDEFHGQKGEINVTLLVDRLLSFTRHLMGETDLPQPRHPKNHHLIAFSGGVDSSLVAALVQQSADFRTEHVQAVLGVSPAVPREQVVLARRVAEHLKISMVEVPTTEGTDEVYRANAGQACLACKTHLYTCLQAVAQHAVHSQLQNSRDNHHYLDKNHYPSHPEIKIRLYNGTNADDLKDSTRVGLLAAAQFQVSSPLEYITKAQVRLAARHLGLPNHHVAASPCLRSRLALGVAAIPEHLQRIEQAERHVRQWLHLPDTASFRVRLLSGQRARLEVEEPYMEQAQQLLQVGSQLHTVLTHQLGFADVSLTVFRSGSVARPLSSTISSLSISPQNELVDDDDSSGSDEAMAVVLQ